MTPQTYNMISYILLIIVALGSYLAYANDPPQLQDFCVGIIDPGLPFATNGFFCKLANETTPEDFLFQAEINVPRPTNNLLGVTVTPVFVQQFPGLNTLGVAMARIDFAPRGLNPPHIHPRATEMQAVLEGTLYVGFVTSNQAAGGNRLFAKVVTAGDIFIFPQGLIHFQLNIGKKPAVALVAFSSQNPGVITIANATFGAEPPISVEVLSRGFNLDPAIVQALQKFF